MNFVLSPILWGMVVLYLLTELTDHQLWENLIQVWILITIVACFVVANATSRRVMLLFSVLGITLLISQSAGISGFLNSFGEMAFVVAFFTVLPILAIPIRLIGYDRSVMQLIERHAQSLRAEHRFIVALSFFYGIFLNLAAVPMSYRSLQSLQSRLNHPDKERFIVYSISQGFNAPMFWTPFSAILGVTVVTFEVSWLGILPMLLMISALSVAFSLLFYRPFIQRSEIQLNLPKSDAPSSFSAFAGLLELISVVLLLLCAILVLESVFQQGLAVNIVILSIPFAFAWASAKGQGGAFGRALKHYLVHQLPSTASIFMVFLTAGFFVGTLQISGFDALVGSFLAYGIHFIPNALVYVMLPWFVLLASFLGLHPLVVLVIFAGTLNWEALQLDAHLLVASFVLGGISTFLVSPFSGTIGLLTSFMQRPYWQVVLPNLGTLIIFHASAQVVIQFVYWFG